MILLACCLYGLEKRFMLASLNAWGYQKYYSVLLLIFGIMLMSFNLRYATLNENRPDQVSQKVMAVWIEHSDPNDMLITAGDLIPQLGFWANRPNTVHLYDHLVINQSSADRFEYLRDQIDQRLCTGESVIFTPAAIGMAAVNKAGRRTFTFLCVGVLERYASSLLIGF